MTQDLSSHDVAVDKLTKFYELVGDLLVRTTRRSRNIQLVSIILSVATSGTLWALIASSSATMAAWMGAVVTTVLSFLGLYQATIGPEQKLKHLQDLYAESGEYLAKLVAEERFDYARFADTVRRFELKIREIETDHEVVRLEPDLPAPRWRRSDKNARVKHELLAGVDAMKREIGARIAKSAAEPKTRADD